MVIANEIRKDTAATGAFLLDTDIQMYVGYLDMSPSSKAIATSTLLELFEKKKKKLLPVTAPRSSVHMQSGSCLIHVGDDIVAHIVSKDRVQRIAGTFLVNFSCFSSCNHNHLYFIFYLLSVKILLKKNKTYILI